MSRRALGKGLGALLGDGAVEAARKKPLSNEDGHTPSRLGDRETVMLPLTGLKPNPHQPRKSIPEDGIDDLAASIRQNGVLQPILVRRVERGFEIVAGERRARAARKAGHERIPALICSFEEAESMKVALLENIQREDLNALEEAEAYQAVMEHYGASHQELAELLGKKRSTVTNSLRLLRLEATIQQQVIDGTLSMGHARTLLGVDDAKTRMRLAREASREGWSVRQLERQVQEIAASEAPRPKKKRKIADPEAAALREFESRLFLHLGSPSAIQRRGRKGSIRVDFFSNEELERILEAMGISSQL